MRYPRAVAICSLLMCCVAAAGKDSSGPQAQGPGPEVSAGPTQDTFSVFLGKGRDDPLDSPSVWRYEAKDALRSPGVPAVDEFKKAITEAEKQRANHP